MGGTVLAAVKGETKPKLFKRRVFCPVGPVLLVDATMRKIGQRSSCCGLSSANSNTTWRH